MDKMLSAYSTKRKTLRWPLAMFYNMLDVSALASFIIYSENNPYNRRTDARRKFLRSLSKQLFMPAIEQRSQVPRVLGFHQTRKAIEMALDRSLSATSNVDSSILPDISNDKQPKYPVPCQYWCKKAVCYFWHITDLHLDTFYSTQGDVMHSCWRIDGQSPSASIRSPGRFGDYFCDSPWSLIESAAKAMKSRQGDNVEFVLWTGDGLSHSALKESDTKRLEILRNITDLLGRTFSSQFVFPVLGHEDGTTNFRHMGELWRHWLPSEALHTFEKGGYYSIEQTKSRLRIIALNTNFMRYDHKSQPSHLAAVRQRTPNAANGNGDSEYKTYYYHHGSIHQHHGHSSGDWMSHGGNYGGYGVGHHRGMNAIPALSVGDGGGRVSALSEYETQDAEKQWIWLEEVLVKSKNNKETVYIVGHIPPGSDERHIGLQQNGHTTFTETNNKRYLELVRKYSSIIQGQFFGHLHSDSFRIIYDDNGKPVSWMMISPSVTPRKLNVGSNNPAMRLYKFDTDSGQVLDYTQYFMDLQLANQVGEPNWLPEYNLTHYYALSDISAISLHNFVDRFTSSDGTWFGKYSRANTVRYQADPCEGVCMLNHYCAITRVDYKEFRQCLEKEQSALRSNAPAAHTVLAGACPVIVLMCALLASSCRQASMLLPKLIACMKVQQQKQQQLQRLTPFGERKKQQIEFVAMVMGRAMEYC
ncbi:acid sphingomyelinase-like phosphodiesterase 3b [Anastrepha obliqua]|uniref:acid sphingomyelinase-like phosphodiesterase 3b n=1 Tax=Anastrepha obliqua TaxID=95512 RepID=UPI0024093D6B|nr:acid sphingomyelinase-like phosphodiesterase 3b [Anastrepha obliqua]